jgi:hypothetical protein
MSKYRLYFNASASASVTVEADDLESAIEQAYDELPAGVCAQCSGWGGGPGIDLGGDWEFDETGHDVDGEYVGSN